MTADDALSDQPSPHPPPGDASTPEANAVESRRRAVLWTLVIEAAGTIAGAFIFWFLTRLFAPEQYGLLGGLLALAIISGPLATFGASSLMVRRLANRDRYGLDIGTGIVSTVVGTVAFSVMLAVIQPYVFKGVDRWTVLIFMLGQLAAFWVTELAIHATLALSKQRLGATMRIVSVVLRLGGFGVYALFSDVATLRGWAWVTLITGVLGAASVHLLLFRSLATRPVLGRPAYGEFGEGIGFGLSTTAEGFLDASDRPLLNRYGYLAESGVYSAGYRLIGLTYIPMMAIIRSADRRMWQAGQEGIAVSYQRSRSLMKATVLVSALAAVIVVAAAPVIVRILPDSYAETAPVLQLLAVLPVMKAAQFPLGNVLTMSGHPGLRLKLTVAAAAANLLLNLWWVPAHSWRGAAYSTLIAEALLLVMIWMAIRMLEQSFDANSATHGNGSGGSVS